MTILQTVLTMYLTGSLLLWRYFTHSKKHDGIGFDVWDVLLWPVFLAVEEIDNVIDKWG